MKTMRLFPLELRRLLQSRLTWLIMALTVAGTRFDYERDRDMWLSVLIEESKNLTPPR